MENKAYNLEEAKAFFLANPKGTLCCSVNEGKTFVEVSSLKQAGVFFGVPDIETPSLPQGEAHIVRDGEKVIVYVGSKREFHSIEAYNAEIEDALIIEERKIEDLQRALSKKKAEWRAKKIV